MNTREQYLQKQNERLQAQLQVVLAAMNNAAEESEFRASVACAFAWDLSVNFEKLKILFDYSNPGFSAVDECDRVSLETWDQSVAEMGKESK